MRRQGVEELQSSEYRLVIDKQTEEIKVFNCETGEVTDLDKFPQQFKDEWREGVGDQQARSYAPKSTKLTVQNVNRLFEKYRTFIPIRPDQYLSCEESLTVTKEEIYLCSHNASSFAQFLGDFSGNYVVAINRATGKILWQRNFSDYTGGERDYSRCAPSVYDKYLYLLSNNVYNHIQSTADPDDPNEDLNFLLFGNPAFKVKGTGRRNAGVVCVNRHTGELVWYKQYGKVAKTYNDPDNFRTFGFSGTIIPDVAIDNHGTTIPVLVAGTNYGAQYFYPMILTQARGNTVVGAGVQRRLRSFVNQGSVMLIHALTGDLLKEVPTGPRNLERGEKILIQGMEGYQPVLDPFIPGRDYVQVRINLEGVVRFIGQIQGNKLSVLEALEGQVKVGQSIVWDNSPSKQVVITKQLSSFQYEVSSSLIVSPVEFNSGGLIRTPQGLALKEGWRYDDNWTCVTLNRDADVLGISEFKTSAPKFLTGVKTLTNGYVDPTTPPRPKVVTLKEGDGPLVDPTYQEVNVRANIVFTQNYTMFEVTNGVEGEYPVSDLLGLRLTKRLVPGDALTDDDAYELRYAGPSCWSAPCPVNYKNGKSSDPSGGTKVPTEFYVGTGQGHKVPYDEVEYFDSDYSTAVPPKSNFYDRQQLVSDAVAKVQQGQPISLIREAERESVRLQRIRVNLAVTSISPRGKMNRTDSIMAIDLRPGNLGKELWYFKTDAFDAWQSYQTPTQIPNVGSGRSALSGLVPQPGLNNGFVNARYFWEQPSGIDGDFGQRPCLVNNKIVWSNKQGHAGILQLTDAALGPTSYSVLSWIYVGSTSSFGGGNYGLAVDDERMYAVQRNTSGDTHSPLRDASSSLPEAQSKNFYVPYPYFSKKGEVWDVGRQYISSLDLKTGQVVWETPFSPSNEKRSLLNTGTGLSCTKELVIGSCYDGQLRFFNSKTGAHLRGFPQELGTSWVGIADNEIYAWIGKGPSQTPTQYLRVYSLK
jgi:hypothetical protein